MLDWLRRRIERGLSSPGDSSYQIKKISGLLTRRIKKRMRRRQKGQRREFLFSAKGTIVARKSGWIMGKGGGRGAEGLKIVLKDQKFNFSRPLVRERKLADHLGKNKVREGLYAQRGKRGATCRPIIGKKDEEDFLFFKSL